jgi:glycosyltransferase involved in cell wall biosynthesis
VVHDRTSGQRARRALLIRTAKKALHLVPWLAGDRFIGVSDFVVERLLSVNGTPPQRTVRIYNGIPLDSVTSGSETDLHDILDISSSTRIVFFSGRAQPYKGVPVLIEAAELLRRDRVPDLAFVCCGDGPALASFQNLVLAKRLDNFFFLGRRDDVQQLLRSATMVAVPSVWAESFGLTVVEAMVANVPVVASRTGGIPELVCHGRNGLLVTPGDPVELAKAIKELLNNPQERKRLSQQGCHDAMRRFDIERTIEALQEQVVGLLTSVKR